jgi:S-DNA-T family DNA segregation ATPase FtsK/SpoIIIE
MTTTHSDTETGTVLSLVKFTDAEDGSVYVDAAPVDAIPADAIPAPTLPEGIEARMAAAAGTGTTTGTLREPTPKAPELWEKPDSVLPAWLKDKEIRRGWARAQRQRVFYTIGLHTVRRGPQHLKTASGRVARGSGRGLASLYGYLLATEYAHMTKEARGEGAYDLVAALRAKRRAEIPVRFKSKRITVPSGAVVLLLAVATWYGLLVVTAIGMTILGMAAAFKAGHNPDAPAPAALPVHLEGPPNEDRITRAFRDAGILAKPAKDGTGGEVVMLVSPVISDRNKAWEAVIDLPRGKKASAAIAKREDVASALGVDEVQVHMERVRTGAGHAARLSLWCAKEDPFGGGVVRSPLIKRDSFDVWTDKIPVGRDARGREVAISLMWASLLVGAVPRQGKTYFIRECALALALDPHVRFIVANGKGDRALKAFQQIAHFYITGSSKADAIALRNSLKAVQKDMNRRNSELNDLSDTEVPEDKLTRELSHKLRWPVTAILLDEVQRYFDVPKIGDEILDLLIDIAKVGPSTGYILMLATQRPDADTIPPQLRDVITYRAALKVMDWRSSEVVLGAGTYGRGYDASAEQLGARKGMALLVREDGIGQLLLGYLADATDAVNICGRGRELREKLGTLTGDAAGERPTVLAANEDQEDVPLWLTAAITALETSGAAGLPPTELANAVLTAHPELAKDSERPLTTRTFGLAMGSWGVTKAKRPGAKAPQYWLDDLEAAADRIASGIELEDDAE